MAMIETANAGVIVRMVTLLEFAKLMNVCPNTVRRWMRTEKLKAGEHYFRDVRVIRFPWSEELVRSIISTTSAPSRPKLSTTGRNHRKLKYRA